LKIVSLRNFSPFLKDVSITTFTTAIVIICNILIVRIIAKGLGPDELGVYTLVRRTASTLIPFTSLSLGIGIARYIGLYAGKGQKTEPILPAAVVMISIFSLLVCAALFPFSGSLSKLIFHQEGREIFFILTLFLLVGENLYGCLYAFYRGRQRMLEANIWNVFTVGIMPVMIAILFIYTCNLSFIVFGIGLLFYCCLFSILPKIYYGMRKTNLEEFKAMTKKLLMYSIPRAPGSVALTMIFTFGVFISPYMGGIANAAYMSIGIWLFQTLEVATNSFGLVALPKVANLIGSGKEAYFISNLRSIYDFVLHIGLFTVIQFFLVVDFIVFAWLGVEYNASVPIARILILSMMPYFFYTMMRNIIDALEVRPINTFNLYLSLFVTVVISLMLAKTGFGVLALAMGLDAGMLSLGILTYLFMKRRYKIRLLTRTIYPVVLINIISGVLIYLIKYVMLSNKFNVHNITLIVSLQLICGILYLFLLNRFGATWIGDMRARMAIL